MPLGYQMVIIWSLVIHKTKTETDLINATLDMWVQKSQSTGCGNNCQTFSDFLFPVFGDA